MTDQEIERIRTFLGSEYSVIKVDGSVVVEKKVEEPIRVYVSSIRYLREPIEYMGQLIPSDTIDCTVHFTIEGSSPKIIPKDDFRNLLSKCLEDYLNKSQ